MRTTAQILALTALLVGGCAEQSSQSEPTTGTKTKQVEAGSSQSGLRDPEAVEQALQEAQAAYLDGRWGDAVLKATAIIEGAADPDEYYMAVKILGMASCSRKDPRPVTFAWKRLQPADRQSLKNACEQQGLTISDAGVVSKK